MIKSDKDHGYAKLMQEAKKAKGAVQVGIFADGAGSEAKNQNSALTVLEVAIFNEFGLGVPERSFIRGYVDENEGQIRKSMVSFAQQIIQGKITQEKAMDLLGLKIVGEIQKRITAGIDPPNAASTIARKGSSTPLIDTGQLRSSISHKVLPQ